LIGGDVMNPGGQLQPSVVQTEFKPVEFPQSRSCREVPEPVFSKLVIHRSEGALGQDFLLTPSKLFGLFGLKVPEQQKLTA
jgi:hypothetical protein